MHNPGSNVPLWRRRSTMVWAIGAVALVAAACQSVTVSGVPDPITVSARVEATILGPAGSSVGGGRVVIDAFTSGGQRFWTKEVVTDSMAPDSVVLTETPQGDALAAFLGVIQVRASPPDTIAANDVTEQIADVLFTSPVRDTVRVTLSWR